MTDFDLQPVAPVEGANAQIGGAVVVLPFDNLDLRTFFKQSKDDTEKMPKLKVMKYGYMLLIASLIAMMWVLPLHDAADIFLESAKIFNYASKAPGRTLAKTMTDVIFAAFAIIFFITRLIIYPRFIVSSVLFEAPLFFGTDWIGFWIFAGLLIILQCLHVFWFYLIAKMIYKLVTEGIEKDERSDDEDEGEDPSAASSGGIRGKDTKKDK